MTKHWHVRDIVGGRARVWRGCVSLHGAAGPFKTTIAIEHQERGRRHKPSKTSAVILDLAAARRLHDVLGDFIEEATDA